MVIIYSYSVYIFFFSCFKVESSVCKLFYLLTAALWTAQHCVEVTGTGGLTEKLLVFAALLLPPGCAAPPSGWQAKLLPPQSTRSLALLHCCCLFGGCASNWHHHQNQRLTITFQTAHMLLFTQPIRQWTSFTLRMFTLEKVANVLETPDSNKTDWEGFCLCSVLRCYTLLFFSFTVFLSTTFFLFL